MNAEPAPQQQPSEVPSAGLWEEPNETIPVPATVTPTPVESAPPPQPEQKAAQNQVPADSWNDGWAVSSSNSSSNTNNATPAPATAATTQASPNKAERSLSKVLHGNAYNIVNNEAAAANVNGELAIPHRMNGRQFAYFEPIDQEGVVSFGSDFTFFFAFDNSMDLGVMTAGLAMPSFGIRLQAAVDKSWTYSDNDASGREETTRNTKAGTLAAGTISAKLLGLDLAINAAFDHPEAENYTSTNGVERTDDIWDLGGNFLISKKGGSISWTFGVGILRFNSSNKEVQQTVYTKNSHNYISTIVNNTIDSAARVEVVPQFNVGGAILSHAKGNVFMGLNTSFPLVMYDRIENVCSRHNEFGISITPNILGEAAIGQYVIVFGSASHQWDLFRYRDSYINHESVKSVSISSGTTTANVGMRAEYELVALELTFTKMFIRNPFGSFSSEDDFATSIGMFINF